MKKLIYLLICFLVFISNANAVSFEHGEIEKILLKLESQNITYDMGEVKKDTIIRKVLVIKNKLDRALRLKEARSSCECMDAFMASKTIERNGIVEIQMELDTTGFIGYNEDVIYILTDDLKYEVISVRIRTHISEDNN